MKLKKLVISLIAILSLSGCSFQEFKHSVGESWVGQNILHPVYDPIRDWINGGSSEEQKKEEKSSDDSSKPAESDPVLQSITVSGSYKTEYLVGESFDKSGIIVTANYDKGGSKDVSSKASFSGFSSASAGSCVVTVSFEGKSTTISLTIVEPEQQGVVISFAEFEELYADLGFSGVEIPDYICADLSATFSAIEGYDGYYLIKPSTTEEMATFVSSFSSAWEDEVDSYGDHYLYLGSPEPGESCPFIYVADYTAESLAGIVICFDEYTEPVPAAAFPLAEVNAYLTENASDYGFTLSQAEADALSALSTSFVFQSGTDDYGYPIAYVIMSGSIASEALAVIESTITSAGFTWYEEYGAFYNSSYCAIYAIEQDSSTYLAFN